ncbi:MAG: metallophosphoesterase, partial [Verrucomicrobiota bacterium]
MTRRHFIRTAALASLSALAGPKILARFQPCTVNRKTICVRGLPPAFDGIRVALLSDFHHGKLVPSEMIRDSVSLANSLAPDLVALGGDYVHRGREWAEGCFRELEGLRAPLGVFGVLGNHDHYSGAAVAVREAMGRAGIVDLTNRGIDIRRGEESVRIGGVGDLWHERQKLSAALAGVKRASSAVLLSHNPDYVERIRDERVGLVLS